MVLCRLTEAPRFVAGPFGLRLSDESRVMGLLELHKSHYPKGRVQASVRQQSSQPAVA